MPRRREVPKREILPDPKHHSELLAKFINVLMVSGKKSVAEKIIYGALTTISSVKVSCSFPVSPFLPDGQASADKKDAAEAKLLKKANSVRIPASTALSRFTPLQPSILHFFTLLRRFDKRIERDCLRYLRQDRIFSRGRVYLSVRTYDC